MRLSQLRRKRLLIILAVILAAGLAGRYVILPGLRRLRVESSIARFQSEPSQANADALVSLIDSQALTGEQAKRILPLLLRPKVTARKAYPEGETPVISVEGRFNLGFRNMWIGCQEYVWANGESQYGGDGSYNAGLRLFILHPKPEKPGTYRMEVRYQYAFFPYRRKTTWHWNPSRGRFPRSLLPYAQTRHLPLDTSAAPKYECRFAVPIDIVVAEREKAEQVVLISNPELDKAMLAAFTSNPRSEANYSYSTPAGPRTCKGGLEVTYRALPAAAVFQCAFVFPDGREMSETLDYREPIRLRANSSGTFLLPYRRFIPDQPGQYTGSIVLRPDPNQAYRDPVIKSIWNGELKFPISFTVEAAR